MAIKINNKNLARRVINWQDVQRVILNWSQIRPTEQKYIDYHIISKWGRWWGWGPWWWVPWWWSTWWSTVIGETGVSNGGTWQTANLNYNWLPSLRNAYKVEIIYSFYWEVTNQPSLFCPFQASLYTRTYLGYQARIRSMWGSDNRYMFEFYLTPYWAYPAISHLTTWNYTITNIIDFENETATWKMRWPWIDESYDATREIQYGVIKLSDSFWVYLNDWVSLSRIDFIVYNTPQS